MAVAEHTSARGFAYTTLSAEELALRDEVRAFIKAELPVGGYRPCLGMSADHDPEFTSKMAAKGWVGMSIPARYGGPAHTAVSTSLTVATPDFTRCNASRHNAACKRLAT